MAASETTAQTPELGGSAPALAPLPDSVRAKRRVPILGIAICLVFVAWATSYVAVRSFSTAHSEVERSARLDTSELGNAIELCFLEEGSLPESLKGLIPKYAKTVRRDPWGGDYRYQHSGTTYRVWSAGRDRLDGTSDDVVTQGDVARLAQQNRKN
jgi:hypothetical protein